MSLLPTERFGLADANGWRPLIGGATGRHTDMVTDRKRLVRLAVTATATATDTGRWFDTPRPGRVGWQTASSTRSPTSRPENFPQSPEG